MIGAPRAALAGMAALALGMGIGRFAYTPLLPALMQETGLSLQAAGYLASANFAGYLIGALASMRLPRGRRGAAFITAIALSVLTTLSMAVLAQPWPLALSRLLSGAASAFIMVQGSAMVLDVLTAHRRPQLFAALYAGVGAGIALTALAIEILSRAGVPGATAWAALGALSALLAIPALGLSDAGLPVTRPPDSASASQPPAAARAKALRALTLAYGGLGFGYVITATFIVVMVRSRADWRAWEMMVWCLVGLAAVPSNWLWQRTAQRFGPWRAMIAAYLLEAFGVAVAAAGQHLVLVMLGAALLGGTFMAITALGLTTARGLSDTDSARVVGRMTAAFGLGQILGPAAGGWLAERSGSFIAPSALAGAVLVASALLLAVAARRLADQAGGAIVGLR